MTKTKLNQCRKQVVGPDQLSEWMARQLLFELITDLGYSIVLEETPDYSEAILVKGIIDKD
jgi:hypothetical protein